MNVEWIFFGDSNLNLFWHLDQALEGWSVDPAHDPRFPELVPGQVPELTVCEKSFVAGDGDGLRLTLVSAVGAVAGGIPSRLDPFATVVRDRLAGIRKKSVHAIFHLGHNDLDFLLWHLCAKYGQDPEKAMVAVSEAYLYSIAASVGHSTQVTIMGVHPVVVGDDDFLECLTRFGIAAPGDARTPIELHRACPGSRFETRVAARNAFNDRLEEACRLEGWRFADITPQLVTDGRVRDEYRRLDAAWEVKLALPPLLPLWLEELELGSPGSAGPGGRQTPVA